RDGDHASAAREADGRLDADDAVDRRRTDDRSVCLGAKGRGAEVRRDRGCRAGARSAWVSVQEVRVVGLPASAAPTTRRVEAAKVGPFAEIRLAENDGASVAEPLGNRGVLSRSATDQGQ